MARASVLLLAAVLAIGAPTELAAAPGADKRLLALERRYERHLRMERPDLATRWGIGGVDDRLEPVTEASLQRDEQLLAALADSLGMLEGERLAPAQHVRFDTLRRRIELERAPLRDGTWRADPAIYLPLSHGAVMDVMTTRSGSPCSRARHAIARLRRVPELLRSAEINLRFATAIDAAGVAEQWREALVDLRTRFPEQAARCRDPEQFARFVEADSLALAATRRFIALMQARAPADPAR